jgi:hypothetical protein
MPRAAVITVTQLTRAIDKAAVLAAERHGVTLGKENVVYKWDLIGRIIREMGDLKGSGPVDVAATLAKGAGLAGTPVAAKIGRDILVGVIAREINVDLFR